MALGTVKTLACVNGKGGVGKTTTLFHLAGLLAKKGKKVLVLDMDKQRNLTNSLLNEDDDYFDNEGKLPTIYDVVVNGADFKEAIRPVFLTERLQGSFVKGEEAKRINVETGIDIIPSDIRLEHNVSDLVGVDVKDRYLEFVNESGYDWVLVDMPPSSREVNSLVFGQIVNNIFVPVEANQDSATGYGDLIDVINEDRIVNPNLKLLGVFVNKYNMRNRKSREWKEYFEDFGEEYISTYIPSKPIIVDSRDEGRPLSYYGKSRYTLKILKYYEALLNELTDRM